MRQNQIYYKIGSMVENESQEEKMVGAERAYESSAGAGSRIWSFLEKSLSQQSESCKRTRRQWAVQ